jgi:putative transposase
MGRLARVVAVDVPRHLTQRGNDRRFILDCDADRATYLSLLRENIELYGVSVMGYCLMSNHVHLIVVPSTADGLATTRLVPSQSPKANSIVPLGSAGVPAV